MQNLSQQAITVNVIAGAEWLSLLVCENSDGIGVSCHARKQRRPKAIPATGPAFARTAGAAGPEGRTALY
jgi:hypothetical protein